MVPVQCCVVHPEFADGKCTFMHQFDTIASTLGLKLLKFTLVVLLSTSCGGYHFMLSKQWASGPVMPLHFTCESAL